MEKTPEEMEKVVKMQWLSPTEGFVTVAKLNLCMALIITMPILIYEIWAFVSPGLTRRERRFILWICTAGSGLFMTGVTIAFCFGVPLGLQFLVLFNQTLEGSVNEWAPQFYFDFLTMACLGFGAAFEMPLVMMGLAKVGLIRPESIIGRWRQATLVMVVLGAVLTPPDPVTQVMLAVLLLGLFFLGYGLACWVTPSEET